MHDADQGQLASLLSAYDNQVRAAEALSRSPGTSAEPDGPIVRIVGRDQGFVSAAVDLALDGDELDALIVRQRDFFRARGESVEWKTRGHDLPAGLPERLIAAGFVPEERETVLIGSAADMAAELEPDLSGDIVIRPVVEDADLRRIADLESEIWGQDLSGLGADLIALVGGGNAVVFVAEADGRIVSAAWVVFLPDTEFAGMWGGSTLAAWRGRGIYRALVSRRARLAVERGVRYLQVDASDDSRPILERLGFVAVTTTTPYVWKPDA
ncbi:GNAT family N-acetyltransferase [Amycolatopsis sp.]|uniref:GNAT family N-acetyltransferase n=1 Tax=Amycolatopsis sp. TaxID=37632 RepID=UPI00260334F7|nr:GNAT family N-acetyltransferase [Amycolatopsis sp.]